ncbi:MAG: hypothetical protein NTW86_01415, partial [Candidatus Sumerlaeota bacterium]|nr:hypothetical protein [Candidatus Sumerlaeota bacterium]
MRQDNSGRQGLAQYYCCRREAWTEEPKGARDEETPGQGGTENVDILIEDVTARAFLSKDGKTIYAP